jgi:hypothetical protein
MRKRYIIGWRDRQKIRNQLERQNGRQVHALTCKHRKILFIEQKVEHNEEKQQPIQKRRWHRQAGRPAGRQTDKQRDRQSDRLTDG